MTDDEYIALVRRNYVLPDSDFSVERTKDGSVYVCIKLYEGIVKKIRIQESANVVRVTGESTP